jgi:hypothetical protein
MTIMSQTRRRPSVATMLAVAGLVVAVVGVMVALAQWLNPRSPKDGADPAAVSTAGPSAGASGSATGGTVSPSSTGSAAPQTGPPFDYIDSLERESGDVAALPRQLKGKPGYDRAIVIACPTNQSSDKTREVTWLLHGRYLDLQATARPYFTADPQSATRVVVVAVTRERDGTLTRRQVGTQADATGRRTGPLSADVAGAEKLTVQVQCYDPRGWIILTDPRVTRAE